jgi:ABC-type transport system involved in multi-copper enzyme maturation permease subunit
MSTAVVVPEASETHAARPVVHRGIPLTRVIAVELRKMFDTRSGFWLMASIAITAVLATGATILWAPESELTYDSFAASIGFPMAVILPMVAILAVTGEWSQRTGLTTFTLIPHRGRVIGAKAIGAVLIGVVSMLLAFGIGALGNLAGTAITGTDLVWDISFVHALEIMFANVLGLMIGFMLGVLIRNSAGAIVAYFVYSFVLPTLFAIGAALMDWFASLQPWIDFNNDQNNLIDATISGKDWVHLLVSGLIWLALPLALGVWRIVRAEVK